MINILSGVLFSIALFLVVVHLPILILLIIGRILDLIELIRKLIKGKK